MSSLIEEVAKQAQVTFSKSVSDECFPESLAKLIRDVNGIQGSYLNLGPDDIQTICESTDEPPTPVIYIEVLTNDIFSMSVFILRNEARIPLHDHPYMHGVLKVIQGTVKMSSYNPMSDGPRELFVPEDVESKVKSSQVDSLIPVEVHMSANVTNKDEPCVFGPTEGNYHEIYAVGGTAAFLDILAPPYDTIERDCHYYTAYESKDPNASCKIWLKERSPPEDFWSDSVPYTGPKISV